MGLFIQLVALLLFLATIGMAGYLACWFAKNRKAPIRWAPALLVRKRTSSISTWLPLSDPLTFLTRLGMRSRGPASGKSRNPALFTETNCFVTFILEGREAEFLVPTSVYVELDEGTSGTLVYKGEWFREFRPDESPVHRVSV
ncbi:MAG: DUF2500 family protein [Armatimonadota bacterium]